MVGMDRRALTNAQRRIAGTHRHSFLSCAFHASRGRALFHTHLALFCCGCAGPAHAPNNIFFYLCVDLDGCACSCAAPACGAQPLTSAHALPHAAHATLRCLRTYRFMDGSRLTCTRTGTDFAPHAVNSLLRTHTHAHAPDDFTAATLTRTRSCGTDSPLPLSRICMLRALSHCAVRADTPRRMQIHHAATPSCTCRKCRTHAAPHALRRHLCARLRAHDQFWRASPRSARMLDHLQFFARRTIAYCTALRPTPRCGSRFIAPPAFAHRDPLPLLHRAARHRVTS